MRFEDIRFSDVIKFKARIDRFLTVLILPALISQILYFVPLLSNYDFWEEAFIIPTYQLLIAIIVAFFAFHSFARVAATYNEELKQEYYAYALPKRRFFDKVKFFWSVKRLKIGVLVFSAVYIIIPTKILFTAFWHYFLKSSDAFLPNLTFKIVSLIVFLILLVLAHISASKDWDIDKIEEQRLKKRKPKKHPFFKELIFTIFVYLVGSVGLWYVWPFVQGWGSFFIMLYREAMVHTIILLAIVIIAPFAYRTIRAFRIRRKLLKGLKKLVKEKKCRITEIKYPYRSIFSVYKGESFRLNVNGVTYSCKIFGAPRKYTPFVLFPDGHGLWQISVRVLRTEWFTYNKHFNFGYESEFPKILIVNPIPKFYFTAFGGKILALDNGDSVGDYKIYSSTAFLNSIDRNCLDR